jgi:hypothetical protein
MAKRAPKRAGRTKTARSATPTQPILPSIVAGALAVGTEVGRAALKAAQEVLGAAGRLAARAATSPADLNILRPAGLPVTGDSRLPEAQLNAIAEARRRKQDAPASRHVPASRKPLARSASQTAKARARRRRRKTA